MKTQLIDTIYRLETGELIYNLPFMMMSILGQDEALTMEEERVQLAKWISDAQEIRTITKNEALEYGCFEDLANWASEEDTLLLVDEQILINLGSKEDMHESLFASSLKASGYCSDLDFLYATIGEEEITVCPGARYICIRNIYTAEEEASSYESLRDMYDTMIDRGIA